MDPVNEEPWEEWAKKQLANPESCVNQILRHGLSKDTAFLMCMLGKIHGQLLDMERAMEAPPDDWQGPR
jgi:hypothetical protein